MKTTTHTTECFRLADRIDFGQKGVFRASPTFVAVTVLMDPTFSDGQSVSSEEILHDSPQERHVYVV